MLLPSPGLRKLKINDWLLSTSPTFLCKQNISFAKPISLVSFVGEECFHLKLIRFGNSDTLNFLCLLVIL
jgi:hypothetical protein